MSVTAPFLEKPRHEFLPPPVTEDLLARAAGEIHGEAVRRYLKDRADAQNDPVAHIRITLARLRNAEALTESELRHLEPILALLGNRPVPVQEAHRIVRGVLNTMLDEEAGPCAVAFAGIALSSVELCMHLFPDEPALKKKWWEIVGADLTGAAAGGAAGAVAGGIGLVPGLICGALAGSGAAMAATSGS